MALSMRKDPESDGWVRMPECDDCQSTLYYYAELTWSQIAKDAGWAINTRTGGALCAEHKPQKISGPKITEESLRVFLAYAEDAGNWSGTPLVGGNVGGGAEERGNLTQLKRAGLIKTSTDEGNTWLWFTPEGLEFAKAHGVEILGY